MNDISDINLNNSDVINSSLPNNTVSEPVNEGGQIDYGKLIDENSERIIKIPDEHYIFISHASNGDGAYPDEKSFVLALYNFLEVNYPSKVYLDLIDKPQIIYTEIIRAAQRSTFGVFICSSRYINVYNGERKEPYAREYDLISLELNTFFDKQRRCGFCMIPVRYGVTSEAFGARSPFGGGTATISIENETSKTHLEKAEYVSLQIIEKIKEAVSKKSGN
ncbi:MAG: hypothetical protein NT149_03230 [Candidatus Gottesmanbacteria bacterium]|nr:hypothetical protein [Candidatus Gottesmanbacteria bacterium]